MLVYGKRVPLRYERVRSPGKPDKVGLVSPQTAADCSTDISVCARLLCGCRTDQTDQTNPESEVKIDSFDSFDNS
jgi:hypothetical protein